MEQTSRAWLGLKLPEGDLYRIISEKHSIIKKDHKSAVLQGCKNVMWAYLEWCALKLSIAFSWEPSAPLSFVPVGSPSLTQRQ